MFIPVLPLAFVFRWVRSFYLKSSREIKRLEALSRSPVYAHLSETLTGLVTVRAFDATDRFRREFARKMNANVEG